MAGEGGATGSLRTAVVAGRQLAAMAVKTGGPQGICRLHRQMWRSRQVLGSSGRGTNGTDLQRRGTWCRRPASVPKLHHAVDRDAFECRLAHARASTPCQVPPIVRNPCGVASELPPPELPSPLSVARKCSLKHLSPPHVPACPSQVATNDTAGSDEAQPDGRAIGTGSSTGGIADVLLFISTAPKCQQYVA